MRTTYFDRCLKGLMKTLPAPSKRRSSVRSSTVSFILGSGLALLFFEHQHTETTAAPDPSNEPLRRAFVASDLSSYVSVSYSANAGAERIANQGQIRFRRPLQHVRQFWERENFLRRVRTTISTWFAQIDLCVQRLAYGT